MCIHCGNIKDEIADAGLEAVHKASQDYDAYLYWFYLKIFFYCHTALDCGISFNFRRYRIKCGMTVI